MIRRKPHSTLYSFNQCQEEEETQTLTPKAKNVISTNWAVISSRTTIPLNPISKAFTTSTGTPNIIAKTAENNFHPSIRLMIFPCDLELADVRVTSNILSICEGNRGPKSFLQAVSEFRRQYFSKYGLFEFTTPTDPVNCTDKVFNPSSYTITYQSLKLYIFLNWENEEGGILFLQTFKTQLRECVQQRFENDHTKVQK